MSAVQDVQDTLGRPANVWSIRFLSAHIPPVQRSGLAWDENQGLPDAELRFFRDGQLLWVSPPVGDSLDPTWDATLPENIAIGTDQELRFELWDRDGPTDADPIGVRVMRGLPDVVLPDSDAFIRLEGGAELLFRVMYPHAQRGIGIREYEVHDDALVVLDVIERSPAGRAALRPGDRIVEIGGTSVSQLGAAEAATKLVQSAQHQFPLAVVGSDGRSRILTLDRGYVWLFL